MLARKKIIEERKEYLELQEKEKVCEGTCSGEVEHLHVKCAPISLKCAQCQVQSNGAVSLSLIDCVECVPLPII